jgi:hypothetical protein
LSYWILLFNQGYKVYLHLSQAFKRYMVSIITDYIVGKSSECSHIPIWTWKFLLLEICLYIKTSLHVLLIELNLLCNWTSVLSDLFCFRFCFDCEYNILHIHVYRFFYRTSRGLGTLRSSSKTTSQFRFCVGDQVSWSYSFYLSFWYLGLSCSYAWYICLCFPLGFCVIYIVLIKCKQTVSHNFRETFLIWSCACPRLVSIIWITWYIV